MTVYLGLDCGGSSSRAVAIDASGSIVHQGQAGPANLANTPPGKLVSHIMRAARESPPANYVCGCFAGLLTSADRERAIEVLEQSFPGAVVRAEPDYFAAFQASDGADVCVVAGTGSIVCSRIDGQWMKSGGRGYILGDVGSAYQYGRAAMLHYLDVGAKQATEAIQAVLLDKFGSLEEPEVLARLYRGGLPAAQLSKLAHALAKDARLGHAYAIEAVTIQTDLLVGIVSGHIERHLPDKIELDVCLAGGLWETGAIFRTTFEERLRDRLRKVRLSIRRIQRAPVFGAVELAKELSQ